MNETILILIKRASRKGTAKAYSYTDEYCKKHHVEEYRVVTEGNMWSLYHYGKLTATVMNGVRKVVYGKRPSDVDSIETFFIELTGHTPEMYFHPAAGVFQVVSGGKVVQQF